MLSLLGLTFLPSAFEIDQDLEKFQNPLDRYFIPTKVRFLCFKSLYFHHIQTLHCEFGISCYCARIPVRGIYCMRGYHNI